MKDLLQNKTDVAALILRLTTGVVIFAHGAQKLFGWFGGFGFEATMQYFTGTAGLPYAIGVLVIAGESIGMVALALGLLTRFTAISLIVIMTGAFVIDHSHHGFFMDWFGQKSGEGFEYDILVIGSALGIVSLGPGAFSADAWIGKQRLLARGNSTD